MTRHASSRPRLLLRPTPVRAFLRQHWLSQNDMARRLHLSRGYWSQLLSGQRGASAEVRARLCAALEMSEQELFTEEVIRTNVPIR